MPSAVVELEMSIDLSGVLGDHVVAARLASLMVARVSSGVLVCT